MSKFDAWVACAACRFARRAHSRASGGVGGVFWGPSSGGSKALVYGLSGKFLSPSEHRFWRAGDTGRVRVH